MKIRLRIYAYRVNRLLVTKWLLRWFILLVIFIWISVWYFSMQVKVFGTATIIKPTPSRYLDSNDYRRVNLYKSRVISKITLEQKYKSLGQEYYSPNMKDYLIDIDRVLREKGLDNNEVFIKGMFYVGQQESHWGQYTVSSFNIKGGHPTGIFQFLPGTFQSVSNGDIFNAEDQVRAFVTMAERNRVDEFAVMFQCNYSPCLSSKIKNCLFNYWECR